jgi:hypothetical protein
MTQVSDLKKVTTVLDARGPRFGAAITTVVFAAALATHNAWFIVAQAIVFAIGAFKGPQFTPYAYIYKFAVQPFLKGEVPKEDVRPPQFAQSVGLLFALVAIAGATLWIEPCLFNRSCDGFRRSFLERSL